MTTPAGRVSITAALRLAYHPVDIRADLAALPWLVTHTKALWIPVLLTVGGGIALVVASLTSTEPNVVTALILQYFVQPPAIGSVFLAGFLAPRASWLLGLIVGLIAAVTYGALDVARPEAVWATGANQATLLQVVVAGFPLAVFGALLASGAAWYRRFLQLSNPNRGRRGETRRKGGTGSDGKSRTTTRDPKASAKR